MATGISITISLSQVAIFFTVLGIGIIIVSSLLIEEWSKAIGSLRDKVIAGSSLCLIAGIIQTITCILLYFKDETKRNWIYIQAVLLLVYIIGFSIPLAYDVKGQSNTDIFYSAVIINAVLLFMALGLLAKDAVPISILFTTLGVGVVIVCCLVLKDFADSTKTSNGKKIVGCSSSALIGGIFQSVTSLLLFFKEDLKKLWLGLHTVIIILLVVCFALPLAADIKDKPSTQYYYWVLGIDFVTLFIVVGMSLKTHFRK